ncbi:MAG: HD-GYP domain-containing protein [Devosia sp.]
MPNRSKRAVLLVTDQPTMTTTDTAKGLGARPVLLDDLTSQHLDNDPCVVFDVDLRKVDNVRRLKSALVRRGTGCRIFLVDTDNRVTSVHANVLGANQLLPRQASVADMRAALQHHFGKVPPAGSAAGVDGATTEQLKSITMGASALGDSFAAMSSNAQLDKAGVIKACEQIADSVCVTSVTDWLAAVRNHHDGTYQHCMLVTGVASAFATKTNMSRNDIVRVTVAGLLHDIGKSTVPTAVLDKPGALTLRETDIIRGHPGAGFDYLVAHSTMERDILNAVRHHHEYLDGSGYPDRIAAADIDEMTRIITVSDVYAALIERRSYKEPKTHAQAIEILTSMASVGKVEARLVREMDRIMAPR